MTTIYDTYISMPIRRILQSGHSHLNKTTKVH